MKNLRVRFDGKETNVGKYPTNVEAFKAAERCIKESFGNVVAYSTRGQRTEIEFRSQQCGSGSFVVC